MRREVARLQVLTTSTIFTKSLVLETHGLLFRSTVDNVKNRQVATQLFYRKHNTQHVLIYYQPTITKFLRPTIQYEESSVR